MQKREINYMSQVVTFSEEILYLQTGKPIKENIPLMTLAPYTPEFVGCGKINNATKFDQSKN